MAKPQPQVKTLVIDNFQGMLTAYYFGDINSGRSWYQVVSGQNPFLKPGQLTWSEEPVQIDPSGTVITDLIMCGKERVESGVLYVYCVGHTGRVYKIQVNNPSVYQADYDNSALIATISINTPTFKNGGFIEFFGSTEQIYIGHDKGLTMINFDGTGEAFVGILGSWTQNVPRPLKQFIGNLYVGNGTNVAEFGGASLIINTYAKLSPGFPNNTQCRDLALSPDGNYLEAIVTRLPLHDVTSGTQQTVTNANSDSYLFKWNGADQGSTSVQTFPSFSLMANTLFQDKQFIVGSNQFGLAVFDPTVNIFNIPEAQYLSPNAIRSTGNMLHVLLPIYFEGTTSATSYMWGNYDFEQGNPLGYWSPFFLFATAPETDVVGIPFMLSVSNTGLGASSNNYAANIFGTSKIYFSSLETSSAPTTKYRFYRWRASNSLTEPVATNIINQGLYQTQTQMFSRKMAVHEVRIYGDPWTAGNSFQIDLNGSKSEQLTPIAGGTKVFTVGGNLAIGDDIARYVPKMAPTYCLGVSITNLGTVNHTINKIEIDYSQAGT